MYCHSVCLFFRLYHKRLSYLRQNEGGEASAKSNVQVIEKVCMRERKGEGIGQRGSASMCEGRKVLVTHVLFV